MKQIGVYQIERHIFGHPNIGKELRTSEPKKTDHKKIILNEDKKILQMGRSEVVT